MRRGGTLVVAAVLALGTGDTAGALSVQITTVRATDRGPSDAQLIELRPRLRRLVGYRSFRVVQEERRHCVWKSPEAFSIRGGRELRIVPIAMRDQTVLMQIQLREGARALVDTDVRLQNRGVMLFGVGQDGHDRALLIMLRAEE